MSAPTTAIKLSNTTPAAPTGQVNVQFQSDGGSPQQSVSASVPILVGDTGSGGTAGLVPAPPAGSATAGKFLSANGTFEVPAGGTEGITALTGDVTASGSGSVVATLATVNPDVGSFTNVNITVDGKGRVLAVSSGSGAPTTHSESLTDGNANFIFAATLTTGGDIIVVVGVPN